ncbi:MAG: inositol monophosphatase [Streptomyces oryziradicis]|nr:inositol monophosphatase [Actinacidiphila oryziradicis]
MGHLDAFLLLGAGPWDIAALVPIIEEAGGTFSDLSDTQQTSTGAAHFPNINLHRQAGRGAAARSLLRDDGR